MHLQHQELVERLVQQHAVDFAALHADLEEAVPEVPVRWADRYPDPVKLNGITRCTCVRQTLFSMFDRRSPKPFVRLTVEEGPGLSVVLLDRSGSRIRVRRWPTDHLKNRVRVVTTPPPEQREAVVEARQMTLDEGQPEPVLPLPVSSAGFDLFVLWWADSDECALQGASLAAVADIDSPSHVSILATAPLPPPARSKSGPATRPPQPSGPSGDFDEDEFDSGASEEGGNSPA